MGRPGAGTLGVREALRRGGSILEVLDLLPFFTDIGERIDADRKMHLRPVANDAGIAFAGFHAFGGEGLIRDEQQRAAGDLVTPSMKSTTAKAVRISSGMRRAKSSICGRV